MSEPVGTSRLPVFVPRTVASYERAASSLADRWMQPAPSFLRESAAVDRYSTFADRHFGYWVGGESGEGRQSSPASSLASAQQRAAGSMVMPRPWFLRNTPPETFGESYLRTGVGGQPMAPLPMVAASVPMFAAAEPGESPRELRAAEALGLTQVVVAPPVVAAGRSPLVAALSHAAWADTQLRAVAAPMVAMSSTMLPMAPVLPMLSVAPASSGATTVASRFANAPSVSYIAPAVSPVPSVANVPAQVPQARPVAFEASMARLSPVLSFLTSAPSIAPSLLPSSSASPSMVTLLGERLAQLPAVGSVAQRSAVAPVPTVFESRPVEPRSFAPSFVRLAPSVAPVAVTAPASMAASVPMQRVVSAAAPSPALEMRIAATTAPTPVLSWQGAPRAEAFVEQLLGVRTAREMTPSSVALTPQGTVEIVRASDAGRAFLRAPAETFVRPAPSMAQVAAAALPSLSQASVASAASMASATPTSSYGWPAQTTVAYAAPMFTPATPMLAPFVPSVFVAPRALPPHEAAPTVYRPGSTAARAEELAATMDLKVARSWGEPVWVAPSLAAVAAEARAALSAPSVSATAVAAPGMPSVRSVSPASWVAPSARRQDPAAVAVTPSRSTSSLAAFVAAEQSSSATTMAGPAAMAQFLDGLLGVSLLRAALPREADLVGAVDVGARAAAQRASASPTVEAEAPLAGGRRGYAEPISWAWVSPDAPLSRALRQSELVAPSFADLRRAQDLGQAQGIGPGSLGVRAEQFAGDVGVRSASLASDFVDPAAMTFSMPVLSVASTGNEPSNAQPSLSYSGFAAGFSTEEWALVSTFRSESTALQLGAMRAAQQWAVPTPATVNQPSYAERSLPSSTGPTHVSPSWLVSAPSLSSLVAVGGARRPAASSDSIAATMPSTPMSAAAGFGSTAARAESFAMSYVGRSAGHRFGSAEPTELAGGADAGSSLPSQSTQSWVVPASDRASLPGGHHVPRGSFTWPRSINRIAASEQPMLASFGAHTATEQMSPGSPLWGGLPKPTLVAPAGTVQGSPFSASPSSLPAQFPSQFPSTTTASFGPADAWTYPQAANMASLSSVVAPRSNPSDARPFLELIRGAAASPAPRSSSSSSSSYAAAPAAAAAAVPSSDAAARLMEAVKHQRPSATSDGRVTLGDLTLISFASVTQQVAASAEGGGPSGGHGGGGGGGGHGGGGGGGGKGGGAGPDVKTLAYKVYDELQRLLEIERERSGDPWES